MVQDMAGCSLYFPIRLRCATVADALANPELEDALARALGRAFAHARTALPTAVAIGDGVALQPPQLVKGDLNTNDATVLLARVSQAIETAARAQALPRTGGRVSGGTPKGVKIRSSKQKPVQISLPIQIPFSEIQAEVRKKIMEQTLDLGIINDRAFIANWRKELVVWTYINFSAEKKPPKGARLQKVLTEIEETIVIPLMDEQFRSFIKDLNDPYHVLSLTPELEYAGMLPDIRKAIKGGLSGWLQIRDQIAASLSLEIQSNLLRFYDMVPIGMMAEARVWPGNNTVIVHKDLLPALKAVNSTLDPLGPLLKVKYEDFWEHRGDPQGLQIRPISQSESISQHALGKAVDIAPHYNPHLTKSIRGRQILTIIHLLGEIESMKNIRDYGSRHILLEHQRKELLEKKNISKDFKDFILEANKRYQEWIEAQEKFKSNFPEVKQGTDRRVALKEVVQRVEEERDVVELKLDEVENTLKKAAEALDQAKQHQKCLEDERKQLRESLSKLRKKRQSTGETQTEMTLSEARNKLKKLDGSLREAKKALTLANQEYDRRSKEYEEIKKEEYEFLNKLIEDLVGDDNLLFSEGTNADKAVTEKVNDKPLLFFSEEVIDPGLAVIREKGYLTIPWEAVQVFLEYGFDWGGLWAHPDFMHFEWAGLVSGEVSHKKK
jgi:D-alanyl-D-alanine carboxypeptidase